MPRPTSIARSPLAQTLIKLRHRLGETQQSFAVKLGTTVTSIARWETNTAPGGVVLMNFLLLSRQHGFEDLIKVLNRAIDALEHTERRKAQQWLQQHERWIELRDTAEALSKLADQLAAEGHPSGPQLAQLAYKNTTLVNAGWSQSWVTL